MQENYWTFLFLDDYKAEILLYFKYETGKIADYQLGSHHKQELIKKFVQLSKFKQTSQQVAKEPTIISNPQKVAEDDFDLDDLISDEEEADLEVVADKLEKVFQTNIVKVQDKGITTEHTEAENLVLSSEEEDEHIEINFETAISGIDAANMMAILDDATQTG